MCCGSPSITLLEQPEIVECAVYGINFCHRPGSISPCTRYKCWKQDSKVSLTQHDVGFGELLLGKDAAWNGRQIGRDGNIELGDLDSFIGCDIHRCHLCALLCLGSVDFDVCGGRKWSWGARTGGHCGALDTDAFWAEFSTIHTFSGFSNGIIRLQSGHRSHFLLL